MGRGEDSSLVFGQNPGWRLLDWTSMDSIVNQNLADGVRTTSLNASAHTESSSSVKLQTTSMSREFQTRSIQDFQAQLELLPESDPFLIERMLHSSSSFVEIIPKLRSNSPYGIDKDHHGLDGIQSDKKNELTATEWMRSLLETQRRTESIQSARLNQAPGCLLCGGKLMYIKDLVGEQWKSSALDQSHGSHNQTAVVQTEMDKTLVCRACHIDSLKDQNNQRSNPNGTHSCASKQHQQPVRVRFTQCGTSSAFLAGSFSHWTQFHVMDCIHSCFSESSESSSSHFETMLDILPGMYYYLFHVDGEWMHDPKKLAYRLPSGVTLNCLNVYSPVETTKVSDHMSMCV